MKRASKSMLRTALAAVPVAALAGLSTAALVGATLVALIVIAALCWTLTDADRSGRLAMLIDASRGHDRQPRERSRAAFPAAGSKHAEAR